MNNKKSVGLPGGPNEYITDISEFISIEGYSTGSKDINNPVNIIESGSITMKDVDFPVLGTDNLGNSQMMLPENNYQFPGDSVFEIPMAQAGGDLPQAEKGWGDKALDYAQTAGSVAGLFPFVGNAVDIVNAGVSGLRAGYAGYTGDTEGAKNHSENAALNLASAIPFAGQAAGTAAIAKDIAQYTGAMDGSAITNIQDSVPASINVAKNTIPNTEPIKIAQSGVELPNHLESVDLSKINEENSTKINSNAYRERLKAEYLNAHNIELSEVDLDNMVGDLNNQLTLGADEGTKGFYTQNVPDGNAAGFMFSGPGQIDIDGNQVTPRTAGYDWNNATTGNIYIARNISQENPYNEIDNENGYGMPGTSMEESVIQHEVNHRLNSLAGSPLSSATVGPLYDESYKYHNSFFDNAPDDNPFNAKFEDESFREYATQPFEIKSQKAQLEQSLLNAGIWDPSKGPFTQSHVDEMVRKNITFNKGFGYLQRGLGINELVEGTIDTPGNLTNPINSYSEYSQDAFNNFLGNRGLEDFSSGYSEKGDMRNSSPRAYNRIKRTLDRTEQGSKKWNEWASKQRPAQEQYFNARGDSKGIKQAIDGDYPDKNTEALLLARGIKVGPNGYYEQKDDAAINTILTEYQNITDQYKNAYDEVRDGRPKEEGLFGAFGPLKNIKGRKAEKKAVKEYNRHYKTDYKEWGDIVFEHNDGGVSQADKNVTESATESSGYNYIINNFDREISSLRDLQRTGGHENRRAFAKSDFKVKGDFRMSRKGGKDDFNLDLANDYISSLDNDPNIDKFNSEYRPANVFDDDAGYQYFGREEGRVLREQGRSNFNAALDNDIWRNDLYTQAVLNLPKGYRDSFIEYYSQEPDQKFTTKAEIKKQAKLVRKIRGRMPDIRNFIESRRKDNEEYIEDGNNQYEIDKKQQLINDELNNQNLNNKIAPNLIKFMNEVAMEDGSMPTELAQAGLEISDSKKLVDSGMNLIEEGHDATRPSKGFYENFNEIFGGTDCHKDRTCIQAVRDIYDNAGLDAGIPKNIYDNETFAENYKEYGYELIENTEEREPGDLLQFYYKNGAVDRKFHMGIYTGDNNYVGDGDPEKPMSLNNIYEYSDGTTKEPFFIYRKIKTKKDDGSLPEAQFGWNDFEKSKVGKFVDAKGLRKDGEYIMNTVGDYFGYENTPEDARRMSLDATAMINPMPDFVNAADHAQQGEYTDAALYAGFGILPFSAGPLVKGVKSLLGVKPKFMSEIDWIKFNKSIPENKILLQEYNLIEETTKANKTWMKNTDGTDFMGTPEQFVQSKSSNFQKAYPDGIESVWRGVSHAEEGVLRSKRGPYGKEYPTSDKRKDMTGIFTADKPVANTYSGRYTTQGVESEHQLYNLAMKNSSNSLKIEGLGNTWMDLHTIGISKKLLK